MFLNTPTDIKINKISQLYILALEVKCFLKI